MPENDKLKETVASLKKEQKKLEQKNNGLNDYKANIMTEIEALKKDELSAKDDIRVLEIAYKDKRKETLDKIKAEEGRLDSVRIEVVRVNDEILAKGFGIEKLDKEKIALEESIAHKMRGLSLDEESKKEVAGKALSKVNDERVELVSIVKSIGIDIERMKIEVDKMRADMSYKKDQAKVLEANIDDQNRQYLEKSIELKGILTRIDKGLKDYNPLSDRVKELKKEKSDLNIQIDKSQAEVDKIEQDKKDNEYRVKSINERDIDLQVKAKALANKNAYLNKRSTELRDAQQKEVA